jgi:hypothetical protein
MTKVYRLPPTTTRVTLPVVVEFDGNGRAEVDASTADRLEAAGLATRAAFKFAATSIKDKA